MRNKIIVLIISSISVLILYFAPRVLIRIYRLIDYEGVRKIDFVIINWPLKLVIFTFFFILFLAIFKDVILKSLLFFLLGYFFVIDTIADFIVNGFTNIDFKTEKYKLIVLVLFFSFVLAFIYFLYTCI